MVVRVRRPIRKNAQREVGGWISYFPGAQPVMGIPSKVGLPADTVANDLRAFLRTWVVGMCVMAVNLWRYTDAGCDHVEAFTWVFLFGTAIPSSIAFLATW